LCIDTFVGIYGHLIKKLTRDYFIKLCYEVKGINMTTNKNHLDQGIDEDEDEKNNLWKIEDGITPDMIQKICQKLNISHYAFDVTKKCFLKHITDARHYPALVYYAINNHMYYISNKSIVLKMIRSSQSMTTFIKSIVLEEEFENKNIHKDAKIYMKM